MLYLSFQHFNLKWFWRFFKLLEHSIYMLVVISGWLEGDSIGGLSVCGLTHFANKSGAGWWCLDSCGGFVGLGEDLCCALNNIVKD